MTGAGPKAPAPRGDVPAQTVAGVENNFHLVRLILALMVAAYHAVVLPGVPSWTPAESALSLAAELGVQGFFVVSGYLVWTSLERSASVRVYAEKRARRLLPGYAVVVLACVAAALIFSAEARANLAAVARYAGWNLVFLNFMEPNLPGLFAGNRFTEVNGALWSLKIEVLFYLALPLIAWFLGRAGRMRWLLMAAIYASAEAWRLGFEYMALSQGAPTLDDLSRQLPGQMSFFITGIALACWRNHRSRWLLVAPLGILLLAGSIAVPALDVLRAAGLGITVTWLATGLPRLVDAARFGDFSYGVYIIHFPVIQTAVASGLFLASPWIGLAASLVVTLLAAALLWWLVERPALRADSAYRAR